MNLLLLLSAFLTALTGAFGGARPAQAAARQEQVIGVAARATSVAVAALPARPVQGWPALVRSTLPAPRVSALDLGLPLFGQRRRE